MPTRAHAYINTALAILTVYAVLLTTRLFFDTHELLVFITHPLFLILPVGLTVAGLRYFVVYIEEKNKKRFLYFLISGSAALFLLFLLFLYIISRLVAL
ncbi:hypothetical protein CHL76_07315 [Marinococcus halophilus]|uniref:Uncharacterized protein n=1 Tax=Marinococcus halophilus TaxID=1371 RepID=A0A510Y4Z5_MARHA|nr:hypothetical protein [Marinococcus halophilus]OZT80332.1 hypothetical protein CHL76_07315 [Marinococcus halophilus]GEK58390.1 hypothetical protein MHA01_12950 [Marinococcus halophilus]